MDFERLRDTYHAQKPNPQGYECLLVFDPGHTTGWAAFQHGWILTSGQIDTKTIPLCVKHVTELFEGLAPDIIVMEDYRIYRSHQKQHVGSDMLTTRVIGSIETLAYQHDERPLYKQGAGLAKGFCTDKKLKDWGSSYYSKGQRHARDAIRHGCYFILFGHSNAKRPGTDTTTMGN